MSLQEQIVSLENKRLLWGIMIENNMFDRVHQTYEKQVRTDFEKKLQQIATSVRLNDSILNVNKQIIVQMMEDIKKYSIPAQNNNNNINNTLVTSEEILTKKQTQFQKGLKTKQEEFNNLIQPVKPTVIDFSDKIEDIPIGSEMEIKLAETIAWREKQLNQVLEKQNTTVASEWITGGQVQHNGNISKTIKASATGSSLAGSSASTAGSSLAGSITSTNAITSTTGADGGAPRNIKIGDPTQIDERNIINVKKVSFLEEIDPLSGEDNSNVSESFMDKLKKKDTSAQINPEFGALKLEVGALKLEVVALKTEITANNNQFIETNKLLLSQQEKIIDMLDRMNFNMGTL